MTTFGRDVEESYYLAAGSGYGYWAATHRWRDALAFALAAFAVFVAVDVVRHFIRRWWARWITGRRRRVIIRHW